MSRYFRVFVAIAAAGLAANIYAAPPGGVGGGAAGAPMGMGGMGHPDTGMHTDTSTHGPQSGNAQDQGKSPTQLLDQNTKLAANLEKILPSGMTAQQACGGFGNLGGCVAAVHVANNLDIPFADLKAKVTGSGAMSLGKAIHALKPDADAKSETRKAQGQAREDLRAQS